MIPPSTRWGNWQTHVVAKRMVLVHTITGAAVDPLAVRSAFQLCELALSLTDIPDMLAGFRAVVADARAFRGADSR